MAPRSRRWRVIRVGLYLVAVFLAALWWSLRFWPDIIGETAEPGRYPWAVRIEYLGASTCVESDAPPHWGTLKCGGTLLSDQFVLTARHCFNDGASYRLLTGAQEMSSAKTRCPATCFDAPSETDVRLVRFERPVTSASPAPRATGMDGLG
jgi:hypothetical protein